MMSRGGAIARQGDDERRAGTFSGFERDRAAHRLHALQDDRQPEPDSLAAELAVTIRVSAEEAAEHLPVMLRRNAESVVANADLQLGAVRLRTDLDDRF